MHFRPRFRQHVTVMTMDTYRTTAAFLVCWLVSCFGEVGGDVVDQVHMTGSKARMVCLVPDQYEPQDVYWMDPGENLLTKNDQVFSSDRRVSVVVEPQYKEWTLVINGVTLTDAGVYACKALTADGVLVYEHGVNVIIGEPPQIPNFSTDATVVEGGDVHLYCNATGLPTPTISWFRYNDRGARIDLGNFGQELNLIDVGQTEAGRYECVANNTHKPADIKQINVAVLFAPQLTLPYERISQDVGKNTLLQCIIAANPAGDYSWQRDGRRLEDGDKYKLRTVGITDSQLMLGVGLVLEADDFGQYTCVAKNEIGQATGSMIVYEPYTAGPIVTEAPQDVVSAGNRSVLLLSCTVENMSPTDSLTWWWVSPANGTRRIFTSHHASQAPTDGVTTHPHKFEVVGHYDLSVKNVEAGDHGTFVCDISGKRNYTAELTVVEPVVCANNGSSIDAGESVHLTCALRYHGTAALWDVLWQHGDRKLSSINNDVAGLVSRLVTFPMRGTDQGVYRCEVDSLLPSYSDGCSMRISMIDSEPTSAAAIADASSTGVWVPLLGTVIIIVCLMFVAILVFVVSYYRRELEKYRRKEEERPASVRYRNGRLSVETQGLTASAADGGSEDGEETPQPQEV